MRNGKGLFVPVQTCGFVFLTVNQIILSSQTHQMDIDKIIKEQLWGFFVCSALIVGDRRLWNLLITWPV